MAEKSKSEGTLLVFGGDGLPEGSHTWYEDTSGKLHTVFPGASVPLSTVLNPEHYVSRLMASVK